MRRNDAPRRRRPVFLVLLLALAGAALFYLRCGEGLGFGPGGEGDGDSEGTRTADRRADPSEAELRPATGGAGVRCQLRLDAGGLSLDTRPVTVEKAIEQCKEAGGAELVVTGDAVEGERKKVHSALEGAGVPVFTREQGSGAANPGSPPGR